MLDGDAWRITERGTILDVLRDYQGFSGILPNGQPDYEDESENLRFRRKLRPYFSSRAVARFTPELRTQATALINVVVGRGDYEMSDAAMNYACCGLLLVLGLPLANFDLSVYADAGALFTYLTEAVQLKCGIAKERLAGDDSLTEAEVVGLYGQLLCQTDCSHKSITCYRHSLTVHRRAVVCAKYRAVLTLSSTGALVASHAEGMVYRVTTQPVTLPNDVALDPGAQVALSIGAASQDGTNRTSLIFGGGRCIGKHLTRLEIAVLVSEWVSRITGHQGNRVDGEVIVWRAT